MFISNTSISVRRKTVSPGKIQGRSSTTNVWSPRVARVWLLEYCRVLANGDGTTPLPRFIRVMPTLHRAVILIVQRRALTWHHRRPRVKMLHEKRNMSGVSKERI